MSTKTTSETVELAKLRAENALLRAELAAQKKKVFWPSRSFLDQFPNGLAFVTRDFKLAIHNQAYEDITGRRDLVPGMPIEDTLNWSCKDRLVPAMQQVEENPERIEVTELIEGRDLRKRVYPYINASQVLEGFVFEILDVTKLIKQERSLEASENLVEGIARLSPSFIYLRDIHSGAYRYRNWDLEEIFGVTEQEFPEACVHPDDLERFRAFKHKMHTTPGRQSGSLEFRLRQKTGEYTWVRDHVQTYETDENDRPTLVLGYGTSINKLRLQYDQLQESEHFIQKVTKSTPLLIYIYDIDRQTNLYANREMSELLGYSTEEFREMERGVYHLIHPEDKHLIDEDYARMRSAEDGSIQELVYRILHKDGHYMYIQRFNTPYRRDAQGNVIEVIGTARDVTELEVTKREKHDQEVWFRGIFEQTSEFLAVLDSDLNMLELNRTYAHVNREDLLGQNWRNSFGVSYAEPLEKQGKDILENGGSISFETEIPQPDGNSTFLLNTVSRLTLDEQALLLLRCTDITELKQAQEALRGHANMLEASNLELEQFAYVASHDLLEPVRIVGQYLELIRRKLDTPVNAQVGQYMDFAVDANRRMEELIKALLDFSRISNQRLNQVDVSLDEIFVQVERFLSSQIKGTQAALTRDSGHRVHVDPILTSALFSNLISNALKFTKQGQTPQVHIDSQLLANRQVEISIRDEGIGIAAHLQERIFQVFQRLHPHSQYSGHGIGLTSAKRIAERHGGSLRLESQEGKGTTFYVTLPAAKNAD